MDDVISAEDIHIQYVGGVCKFKGSPIYVLSVGDGKVIRYIDMRTGNKAAAPFSFEDFQPPTFRLGFMNSRGSAVYMERVPVRKMQVGIMPGNIKNHTPEGVDKHGAHYAALLDACKLHNKCVYNTLMGIYPSFSEALSAVKEEKAELIAFDRQFAIDKNRDIIYKTKRVGSLPRNCTRIERIKWNKGHEHLEILIGDNCEKSLRDSRA